MKKFLVGCLVLITACQGVSSTLAPESTPTAALQPPPQPATATVTFTPVPTATQPPSPPPLYFTDEFDTASPFWEFLQSGGTDSPLTAFSEGALRIDIPAPHTWYLGIHNAHTYSNVLITAKSSALPTGSIGLICRYDESIGWFEFNIASDGIYSVLLGEWLAPGIAKYVPIATDGSNQLNTGNINHEIGLSCQDNLLNLYVNGTLLRRVDVTNYGLSEGNIGITAASFKEAPMTAVFDWVKVDEK